MSGRAWVAYAQIYVESADSNADLGECFAGQRNGLCGAAVAGKLFLMTGLHTGKVGFTVEVHDAMPRSVEHDAEEIVEASYQPIGDAALKGWGGEGRWPLDLEDRSYRVRYSAWGMDEGHQAGPPMEDDPLVDRYLLQFWPAPPAPDRVIRQTSKQAAYRHKYAQEQPTPAQLAEQKREKARLAEERKLAEEAESWGGTLPTARLREVSSTAREVARLDRSLVDGLVRTYPAHLRLIARWAARRAMQAAGLSQLEWVAAALDGMDRGDDLWDLLRTAGELRGPIGGDQPGARLVTRQWGWDDDLDPMEKLSTMLFAVHSNDPLRAALDAIVLTFGAFGKGRERDVIDELNQEFPWVTSLAG
ncbi:hypothetical protein AB0L70_07130 [Kribbella sp. NPDC051952]|uniref:hypothetical protein n=1 Tax=Kribbella sp. NPDC051952 TaxID=3154851 RepID=UPI0034179346